MDYKDIMELTKWLEQSAFTAYSLNVNGVHLTMSKQQTAQQPPANTSAILPANVHAPVALPQTAAPTEPGFVKRDIDGHIIKSPIVGTFYKSASPEGKAFVEIGQRVKKGDVLCVIEAMKVMNEIISDVDGAVLEIFISNGDMVEARMPLFKIEI